MMAREDYDPDDVRSTRSTRQGHSPTDRLTSGTNGHTAASDRNWRPDRATRRRRAVSFPTSRQELALWLQYGGWRTLLIVIGVVVMLLFVLFLVRNMNQEPLALPTPTADPAVFQQPLVPPLATVTPAVSSPAAIDTQGVGGSNQGAQFRVSGTGSEGLFLRPEPNSNNQPLKTIPDESIVTIIGEDFSGPDRVWKNIRDADGAEGWAAADWLKPVTP
jgi:hypothetical protein